LRTTSLVDSRTILDQAGAEKLLGHGDMLYLAPDTSKSKRIQGSFLSTKEVEAVTNFIRSQRQPAYNEEVLTQAVRASSRGGGGSFDDIDDELYNDAVELVINRGQASSSDLMRRLRIGYSRSARLIDMLEERGVVGPKDGSKPREVLVGSVTELAGNDHESEPAE